MTGGGEAAGAATTEPEDEGQMQPTASAICVCVRARARTRVHHRLHAEDSRICVRACIVVVIVTVGGDFGTCSQGFIIFLRFFFSPVPVTFSIWTRSVSLAAGC